MNELISRLNQPFPSQKPFLQSVRSCAFIAIFIVLFLYFFKPFGLHNVKAQILQVSLSFGLISFLFSLMFDVTVRYGLKLKTDDPSWTLLKWILVTMSCVCWIALGNFLLIVYGYGWGGANLEVGLLILKNTLLLGILPIIVSGLIAQMNAISVNQTQAKSLTVATHKAHKSTGAKPTSNTLNFDLPSGEFFSINPQDVLCVEAMQNYVLLHYHVRGEYKTQIIRSTMVQALQKLSTIEEAEIIRCHRSYVVNLLAVKDIKGNAQGLKLTLENVDEEQLTVPVSRSYITDFKTAIALIS